MGTRVRISRPKPPQRKTLADNCAELIGSWRFITTQAIALILWVVINSVGPVKWDRPPFILLNLMLSFQAAFTGPVLLMAANRQSEIDRERDINHYLLDIHETDIVSGIAADLEKIARTLEERGSDENLEKGVEHSDS